jgi:hypothetical protein
MNLTTNMNKRFPQGSSKKQAGDDELLSYVISIAGLPVFVNPNSGVNL